MLQSTADVLTASTAVSYAIGGGRDAEATVDAS
jgi:hypothetical protein